jgi:hypothetical protein
MNQVIAGRNSIGEVVVQVFNEDRSKYRNLTAEEQSTLQGLLDVQQFDSKLSSETVTAGFVRPVKLRPSSGILRKFGMGMTQKAINAAMAEVEKSGAHVWLTDAVIHLQEAKDLVASYAELQAKLDLHDRLIG